MTARSLALAPVAYQGSRPATTGKFFAVDGRRFPVRGVTYGTFASRAGLFPEAARVRQDFAAMAAVGVNTVRTYTVPDELVLDLAATHGLRLLIGVWWDDPRYLHPPTAAAWTAMAGHARTAVRDAVDACAGHPATLAFLVGNEIPEAVVRYHGRGRVEQLLTSLLEAGKDRAGDALIGYANYPTTGYLDTSGFDFDAVNVFLEDSTAFRRYLAQLQVANPARPLLLTELGLDSARHGQRRQAEVVDWQLRAAVEAGAAGTCVFSWTDEWWVGGQRVNDWHFGLTTAARRPKAALGCVSQRYRSGLLGCRDTWPRVSVVVCAYQEEATIAECLESLVDLHYPNYEVIVVDDGSTDATAWIVRRFPVRLIRQGQLGLSVARNTGLAAASGDVVAYIDADAAADPDWLTYLALGLDHPGAVGVGGPNLAPPADPVVAQCVALAPGGPSHVLLDDEQAEHVPGCNMAFRRTALAAAGGFDPAYRTAGDDVDVCWRLQDRGGSVRFHPAAVVWHHPRRRVRTFWRQQVGYGRAEALVARKHPGRFDGAGRSLWRGVVYGPAAALRRRGSIYTGELGQAPFQRLYAGTPGVAVLGGVRGIAAIGIAAVIATAGSAAGGVAAVPLPVLGPPVAMAPLLTLPAVAVLALVMAYLRHGIRAARRDGLRPTWVTGALVAWLHLLQPLAREIGRRRWRRLSFPAAAPDVPWRLRPAGRQRYAAAPVADDDAAAALVAVRERLRAARLPAVVASAWESADLRCDSPLCWRAELVGYTAADVLYLRLGCWPRAPGPLLAVVGALAVAAVTNAGWLPAAVVALAVLGASDRFVLMARLRRALLAGDAP